MEELPLSNKLDRRVFVKGLGLVSASLVLGIVGGCDLDKIIEAIKNRPIRRRLRVGSPEVDADIATYKQAVTLMQGLPVGDQRRWDNVAAIHGTAALGFKWCQHHTPHFFDWHRGYLLNFERICQKLTGNPKFGLPYWNWNQNPAIHPDFLSAPLFLARNHTTMATEPSGATGTSQLDTIFSDSNFFSFQTQLEGTPHDTTHVYIGGTMGGGGSALDPLFWAHHCMIDYCWAKWNLEMGNNNTNDSTWINTVNSHYVDQDGNPADALAGITTIMPLISYQYESSAIGSNPATAAITSNRAYQQLEKRIRAGANVKFDIKQRIPIAEKEAISIVRPLSKETKMAPNDFASIINSDAAKERIFTSVEFAQLPPSSDFAVRVFVNLPNANSATPIDDPHYAGSFAFFGTELPNAPAGNMEEHTHTQPRFLVNITNTLQRLKGRQELRDASPISVQLVAVPFGEKFEREDTQLVLNKIEIIITPVIINTQ
jgi:tyrosinase